MTTPSGAPAPGKAPRARKTAAADTDPYKKTFAASRVTTSRQNAVVVNQATQQAALAAAQATAQGMKNLSAAAGGRRPAGGSGAHCGDGNLYVCFLSVGQGDCTIISTPGGRVVLIDCGSTAAPGVTLAALIANTKAVVYDRKFIGLSNQVDILITTHPDADHYNKLEDVLGSTCQILTWYHSADRIAYSVAQTSAYLATNVIGGPHGAQRVIINDDPSNAPGETTVGGAPAPWGNGPLDPALDPNGGIRIYEDVSGCMITLLAAGVNHPYHNETATPENRGSIVTLVEFNKKKLLICGDATKSTEQFLIYQAGTQIRNVDVIQIGHHASKLTSSLPAFVGHVNPVRAIASAGLNILQHRLPSKEVLDRYETQMKSAGRKQAATPHAVGCWEELAMNNIAHTMASYTYDIDTTGQGLLEVTL